MAQATEHHHQTRRRGAEGNIIAKIGFEQQNNNMVKQYMEGGIYI